MSTHSHHDHSHEHSHDHSHVHGSGSGVDKVLTLLSYNYDHNDHHADELDDLIREIRAAGKDAAADKVAEAQEAFRRGNALLHDAIHLYTEE